MIFQNDEARAKKTLTEFQKRHPTASGTLAGKTGILADTLQTFLASRAETVARRYFRSAWRTYGGAPDRTCRVPGGIPTWWPSRPSWHADIPQDDVVNRVAFAPPGRPPFGYPVVANGEVFVASANHVYSFGLQTGKPARRLL